MSTIFLNYEAVKQASVSNIPCPHVVVTNFIEGDALKRVVELLPDIVSGGSFPPESLALHPELVQMVEEFQGPELKAVVAEKFGIEVQDMPSMLTMRGRTREKDGRIHRDSASKLVTILLYLNSPDKDWGAEGCFRFTNGPDDIEDYAREVPPVGGTLVIFPNGPTTWHGHRQYVGPRYTIQLNYMATDARAYRELARHKLSAFWKRLPFVV